MIDRNLFRKEWLVAQIVMIDAACGAFPGDQPVGSNGLPDRRDLCDAHLGLTFSSDFP